MLRLKSFLKVKFRSVVLGCLLYRNRLHVAPKGTPVAGHNPLSGLQRSLNKFVRQVAKVDLV